MSLGKSFMKDDLFFDTNILFYAYDLNEPTKRRVCKQIVEDVFLGKKRGIVSNKILVELYTALTRKLQVSVDSAKVIVESFIASDNWLKVDYNQNTVRSALSISHSFKSSFLYTLIAETMKSYGISRIITKNESDFRKIPGLKIINPLE